VQPKVLYGHKLLYKAYTDARGILTGSIGQPEYNALMSNSNLRLPSHKVRFVACELALTAGLVFSSAQTILILMGGRIPFPSGSTSR
jgi:hypothetical protein